MQNLEDIGRELERQGKADAIKKLAASADGQKLGKMVDQRAVEKAVKGGDTEALRQMLGKILATSEGQRLAANLKQMMESKD